MNAKADNFFKQYRKPFGLENLMCLCMISREEADSSIDEGLKTGVLIEPIPGIFFAVHEEEISHSTIAGKVFWKYNAEVARQVIQAIRTGGNSARTIGKKLGVSYTYAQKYLEALASIGCIRALCVGYEIISEAQLEQIGTRLEKGIITRQRKAACFGGTDASNRHESN